LTGFAIGWVTVMTVPVSKAFGGSTMVVIDPRVTYTITEIGWQIMFAVGGTFLGVALIAAAVGSTRAIPAWVRWFTLIVGVIGLVSLAWIPFFALGIWAIIVGIWLIASARSDSSQTAG
jgi:hypothetical protein